MVEKLANNNERKKLSLQNVICMKIERTERKIRLKSKHVIIHLSKHIHFNWRKMWKMTITLVNFDCIMSTEVNEKNVCKDNERI